MSHDGTTRQGAPPAGRGSADRRPWLLAGVGGIAILLLGIDIGVRLGAHAGHAGREVAPPPGSAAEPRRSTDRIEPIAPRRQTGHGARGASEPPTELQRAAAARLAEWTDPPRYATRDVEPPLPRLAPEVEAVVLAAEKMAQEQPDRALDLYRRAAAAAGDPRHAEDLRLRCLVILIDRGRRDEARKLAREIGARPVRGESRETAAELLAKLGP